MELIEAIKNKDFKHLHDVLFTSNKASTRLFKDITGLPVDNQNTINESIRSLDPRCL